MELVGGGRSSIVTEDLDWEKMAGTNQRAQRITHSRRREKSRHTRVGRDWEAPGLPRARCSDYHTQIGALLEEKQGRAELAQIREEVIGQS